MRRFVRHIPGTLLALAAASALTACAAIDNAENASNMLLKGHSFDPEMSHVTMAGSTFERPLSAPSATTTEGFKEFLARNQVKGLIVSQGDDVVFETYARDHGPDKLWNTQGISTTMLAVAVGAAIADGKIPSVDQMLSYHLPQLTGTGITWRHALTMTDNIEYYETPFQPVSQTGRLFADDDFSDIVTELAFLENKEPGERFNYSSLTAQLTAEALQAVYDAPIERIITNEVWLPMRSGKDAEWATAAATGQARAGCCVYMNVRDQWRLGRFLAANVEHQVGEEFYAEMVGPAAGRGRFFRRGESRMLSEDWGYGFGTWFAKMKLNGEMVATYGSLGFGGQVILNVPKYDMTLAVQSRIPPTGGRIRFYRTVLEHALNQEG